MLTTYPEIRDRIYELARKHNLRLDWRESGSRTRTLLLYDSGQVVVARGTVPLRHSSRAVLEELDRAFEGVFGEGWMN